MARATGFEPAASCSQSRRSSKLRYTRMLPVFPGCQRSFPPSENLCCRYPRRAPATRTQKCKTEAYGGIRGNLSPRGPSGKASPKDAATTEAAE